MQPLLRRRARPRILLPMRCSSTGVERMKHTSENAVFSPFISTSSPQLLRARAKIFEIVPQASIMPRENGPLEGAQMLKVMSSTWSTAPPPVGRFKMGNVRFGSDRVKLFWW